MHTSAHQIPQEQNFYGEYLNPALFWMGNISNYKGNSLRLFVSVFDLENKIFRYEFQWNSELPDRKNTLKKTLRSDISFN